MRARVGEEPAEVIVHLVRHGVAEGAGGLCVGHHDLPLSLHGRGNVARLATGWPEPRPALLYTSDLARARASAAAIAELWGRDAPPIADRRLREMDFGEWDGRSWPEVHARDADALARWGGAWWEERVPGGEGFGDVIARAGAWLVDALRHARSAGVPQLGVVAHAGSIRALLVHAVGLPRELAFRFRLDHARATGIRVPAGAGVSVEPGDHGCGAGAELLYLNTARVPVAG